MNILIVDDDRNLRKTLGQILRSKGFEVEEVGSGAEAIDSCEAHFYNLVLLDVRLKDIAGLEVLKAVLAQNEDTIVIMMTGFASLDSSIEAMNNGAYFYVIKPMNMDAVLLVIDRGLERQRLSFENKRTQKELQENLVALKKAKEKAEAATKVKSEFLNSIAHDFRTPVHAIMGFSAFLQLEHLTKKQMDLTNFINKAGKGLLGLIEELLDISRLESGMIVLRSVEFDLDECVRSIYEISKVALLDKDITMTCFIEGGIPRLKGDSVRLGQILFNLIGNAVKFTDHGEISVKVLCDHQRTDKKKYRIKFFVKDTGFGIPKDKQEQIFDAFVQLDEFIGNKERGGVGLGLYITKTLVHLMNGEISVSSEVGVGSEFIVTLDFDMADQISS